MESFLKAQNETLKAFTESQTSTMNELSASLKSLTQTFTGSPEGEPDRDNADELSNIIQSVNQNDGNDQQMLNEDGEELTEEVKSLLQDVQDPREFGPSLTQITSSTIQSICKYVYNKETSEKWKLAYKTPENCIELCVPSVNPEIWSGLPMSAKSVDAKHQNLQQHLIRSLIAQAMMMDKALKLIGKNDLPAILAPLLDSTKSISLAMQEINQKRRFNLRPFLKSEYAALCSTRVPVTKFLFGDNLEQSLKEVKATSVILKPTGPPPIHGPRFHPYKKPFYKNDQNLNFKRPPSYNNRGGQFHQRGRSQFQRGRRFPNHPFQHQ